MYRFFVGLFFASLGFSLAQSDYVNTFYITELSLRPAEIILSPNHITILEFEDSVDEWASGQGSLFTVEQSGSKLYFTTGQRGGSTDLVIDVGGRTALFKINIDSETPSTHRYIIRNERPSGGYATPLSHAIAQRTQPQSQPSHSYTPSTYPIAPSVMANTYDNPNISGGRITLQPSGFNEDGNFTIFFTYVNDTPHNISLIARHASITQNGMPLQILNLNKEPLKNLVAPNETQSGYILVGGAAVGQLIMHWRVMALTPQGSMATTLTESVQAQ